MEVKKNRLGKGAILLALALSLGLHACNKDNEAVPVEGRAAKVIVSMLGLADETAEPDVLLMGTSSTKLASGTQESIVPFNDDITIVSTLVPEGMAASSGTNSSLNRIAAVAPVAAATVVRTPLGSGVQYRVIVYDSNGNYIADRVYVCGDEGATEVLKLDAGKSYTFVALSNNSSTSVTSPVSMTSNPLSEATVSNTTPGSRTSPLLYFKKAVTLTDGDNALGIILKNRVSQITTKLTLASSVSGTITAISGASIAPVALLSFLALDTGLPTFTSYTAMMPVTFGTLGARTVTSDPTVVHINTTDGELTIGSITIGGVTKSSLVVAENLKIIPGLKYNLNVTFQ